MKHEATILSFALCTFFMLQPQVRGDLIAQYAFDGATLADSAGFIDVTASDIAIGVAADADNGFSTGSTSVGGGTHSLFLRGDSLDLIPNSTSAATADAIAQGNYISFTLSSTTPMFLTSLTFDAAKNAGNMHQLRMLATSSVAGHAYTDRLNIISPIEADGSLADVLQSNVAPSISDAPNGQNMDWGLAAGTTIDLSDASFQGLTSIDFQLYAFAINTASSSISDVLRFDNIRVNGSTIPEPSSAGLLMIGLAAITALRRR